MDGTEIPVGNENYLHSVMWEVRGVQQKQEKILNEQKEVLFHGKTIKLQSSLQHSIKEVKL